MPTHAYAALAMGAAREHRRALLRTCMGRGSRAGTSTRHPGRSGPPAGHPHPPAGPPAPPPRPPTRTARRRPRRPCSATTRPAGNSNTTRAPRTDGATASRPPWSAATAAAMARPRPRRPRPPRPRLPARTNSATGAGNPGPLSLTSTRARVRSPWPWTSTTPPPCSIAFAIRLPVTCASRRRSPHTVRASPDHEARSSDAVRGGGRAPGLDRVRHQLREVDRFGQTRPRRAASAPRRGRRAQARRDRARGRSRGGGRT